jgi:hypothetical protein
MEPSSSFVASAVPVEFYHCNDSITRVAGRLWVPTMRSRDILHQAKRESSWLSPLRSDGSQDYGGGWSGRAVAQQRPRVLQLVLKGPSDHHSNETAVEAARWGASGPNKRATLMEYLLKRERWTTALSLTD